MVNPKKRKLTAIRKLFDQREQAATSKFADALQTLRQEVGKDESMQAYLSEYRDRYADGASGGMAAGHIKGWQRFLGSLENASQIQRKQAEQAREHVDVARVHVVASRQQSQAGETLEERLDARLARAAARRERQDLEGVPRRRG